MEFKKLVPKYAALVRQVKQDHVDQGVTGGTHDWTHALAVACRCTQIAEDVEIGELAFVAGLIHNTDRLYPDDPVTSQVERYLDTLEELTSSDKKMVLEAVLTHSHVNGPDDNPVTIVLMDADRLVNMSPTVIIRAGQFFPSLPAVDLRSWVNDPDASYKQPRSVTRTLSHSLEWGGLINKPGHPMHGTPWLRTPRARKIAEKYCDFLQQYLTQVQQEWREVGLFFFPKELEEL